MSASRFPSPQRHATFEAFSDSVYRWLCHRAMKELYRAWKAGEDRPTHEVLTEYLDDLLSPHASRLGFVADYQSTRSKYQWDGAYYVRQIERAATFALERSDPPAYFAEQSRRGQKSRRGPKYHPEMLAPLDGLTAAEQAERLGCSVRTIMSLRAEAKAEAQRVLEDQRAFELMMFGE